MRTPIIAGNWKMNTTVEEAVKLVKEMAPYLAGVVGIEKVVCPPFVSLTVVRQALQGADIRVGAQNMYHEEKGAFTGEVSPLMLAGLCEYVILGHSERRQHFAESDELVNKKLRAALKFGLKPIFCVGERLSENEAGKTEEVITRQVREGLRDIADIGGLVAAYEPIWAIGTGKAATGRQAGETIGLIRRLIRQSHGKRADELRIQYGGSVTSQNIEEFMSQPDIDGGLVGGASLKPREFADIVIKTAAAKLKK